MRLCRLIQLGVASAVAVAALVVVGAASAATITRTISSGGTFAVPSVPAPQAGTSQGFPEVDPALQEADPLATGATVRRGSGFDRHGRHGREDHALNPRLAQSFDGLNFFDQRFANGGNQFSLEPPDQGLCVGKGKIVEVVNDVYQVFDSHGHALTNPIDLNTLFGFPAAINRSTGQFGPEVFDPSCLFDRRTGAFFVVASVLDRDPTTGGFTGPTHLEIGVASDPTSALTLYQVDTTSDAACTSDGVSPGPCFPDYPHIGADRNGFYITTNVFDFFGPNYDGVNIYAFPKAMLASGAPSVPVTIVGTNGVGPAADGGLGFALIPAVTPGDRFASDGGGTEYLVSSRAVFANDTGTSSSLDVWSLSNTRSLLGAPNLRLSLSLVNTGEYGVPAPAVQKTGNTPLATCIGSIAPTPPPHGPPCWSRLGGGFTAPTSVPEGPLDANDSRVGGVSYADGTLWAVLGSAATDSRGAPFDGVAWFVMNPRGRSTSLSNEGMLVKDGTNLTYPSIAVTEGGDAVMGFTIVGPRDYPSAGYAGLDARRGTGDVQYAARGAGPQDGFTEYDAFGTPSFRPRWGDYGAAVADGSSVWVASEYIGQTCTFHQYVRPSPSNAAAFGTCGDTRGALGNWDTRISQLTP